MCFKLNKDTRGLSLVEMVVSIAILVIVGGALLSFFAYSVMQSSVLDQEGTVHMESQSAWSQMRNEIENSNGGIYSDGHELVVYNRTIDIDPGTRAETVTEISKTVFTLKDNHIVYNYYVKGSATDEWDQSTLDMDQVFAAYVKSFDIRVESNIRDKKKNTIQAKNLVTEGTKTDRPDNVNIRMELVNDQRSTVQERNVVIRNTIKWIPKDDTAAENALFTLN